MMQTDLNKATATGFFETAFGGEPELAVVRYLHEDFIEHNAAAAGGPQAFVRFVRGLLAQHPAMSLRIERVVAEGDLVVTHGFLTLDPGDETVLALADIFRVQDDKLVEHWDVVQTVPRAAAD